MAWALKTVLTADLSAKLAEVAAQAGHEIVWFGGELGPGFEPGVEYPPARFDSVENQALQAQCFGVTSTPNDVVDQIRSRAAEIAEALRGFVSDLSVDVLVPQNALSIPMQLSLGLALAQLVQDGVPMVAHHHDFGWERDRFSPSGVPAILEEAFPPVAANLRHMVINSIAQAQLLARRGAAATLVPNVMDFENRPPAGDGPTFRRHIGISEADTVLLQATRIVPRKMIERTLQLAAGLDDPGVRVVISHAEHDEGDAYAAKLAVLAGESGVDLLTTSTGGPGEPSLADAYAAADLVTYPSEIEGFGNALLEAVFYGKPILVNRYPVYVSDIAPTGLRCLEMQGAITSQTVRSVAALLADPVSWQDRASVNYEICRRNFSYAVLRHRFLPLLQF